MAITHYNHSTGGINGGYDPTTAQATINALKTTMVSGAIIYATHFNSLIDLWNSFNGHTHGITDRYGIWDYGDGRGNPGYAKAPNSSTVDTTSDIPNGLNSDIGGVSQGGIVYAAKTTELVNALTGKGDHTHTWTDRNS